MYTVDASCVPLVWVVILDGRVPTSSCLQALIVSKCFRARPLISGWFCSLSPWTLGSAHTVREGPRDYQAGDLQALAGIPALHDPVQYEIRRGMPHSAGRKSLSRKPSKIVHRGQLLAVEVFHVNR